MNVPGDPAPADVVAFWRNAGPDKWFVKDDAFDREVADRFGALHAEASAGAKDVWADDAEGALALILLLDQFSRNIHRGSAAAFAQDAMARQIAGKALEAGFDRAVDPRLRQFFYLPFMHSESIVDQQSCVRLCHGLSDRGTLPHALDHARIIRRFGRFPHRNAVLGRHTSPAERAFLDGGGFAG